MALVWGHCNTILWALYGGIIQVQYISIKWKVIWQYYAAEEKLRRGHGTCLKKGASTDPDLGLVAITNYSTLWDILKNYIYCPKYML